MTMINGSARKRGRRPIFVLDYKGKPITGLSKNKANGFYYATYSEPRVYFGSDFATALFKFRQWQNQQAVDEPYMDIPLPSPPNYGGTTVVKWSELCVDPPEIAAAYAGESVLIPEDLFLETARNFILKDTIEAARKLGIPELARMEDLPPLEPPLSLERVLEYYLDRNKPSKDERKKMKSAWKGFCDIVKVRTVGDISSNLIHDYRDVTRAEHEKNGWSTSWLKARFPKVKTLFRYYRDNGRTNKKELKTVLDFCRCLKISASVEEDARPIEREYVHKLLSACSTKWRAIILIALNCGYYAKDIHDLKESMIKNKDGLDYIVFPREKNKHKRVNVLWSDTKEALDQHLAEKKFNTEYVFTSQFGSPFDPHDVQRCFDRLRKKVEVPNEVKFSHFRDGAASALFGEVNADMLKVTIGHRIKGEKSKYISVKPEKVKKCADIIYKEYFG